MVVSKVGELRLPSYNRSRLARRPARVEHLGSQQIMGKPLAHPARPHGRAELLDHCRINLGLQI